jgi:hypothetical protein
VGHRDFDAVRSKYTVERDPITFQLAGEAFTCLPEPSLGDVFAVYDAPDVDPDEFSAERADHVRLVRILVRFIRKMVVPEDRDRFEGALLRVPASHGFVIIELGQWIVTQVTNRPTVPSAT